MDEVQMSVLTDHTGYWLRMISNQVSLAFAKKLESRGVTVAEWVVLREMFNKDHTKISPSDVARLTGQTRGAISKLISRLLEKDLVIRTESIKDKRFQDIKLTVKAKKLLPKLALAADQNDEIFFSALSKTEHKQLKLILKKLAKAHKLYISPIK